MQRIILGLGQALRQRILALGLMILMSLSGLFIFFEQPSYAVTSSADKLSQEDKIDRAYQFREGAGILEEVRQEESPNKDQPFDPSDKAKVKSVKASKEPNPEPSLVEQAKKVVEKVTGQQ